MGFWSRKKAGAPAADTSGLKGLSKEDVDHLKSFASTRVGVEMYVEPRTSVTEPTVILIATSGEWTRRRVSGPKQAYALAQKLGIPVYDVGAVGYPSRMRSWTHAQRRGTQPPTPGP